MQLTLDRIGIINGDDEPTDSVTMDQTNAFNSLSKERVAEVLENECSLLYNYYMAKYGKDLDLWITDMQRKKIIKIVASKGVIQGGPISSLTYCYTSFPALRNLNEHLKQHKGAAKGYIDDNSAAGPSSILRECISSFVAELKESGLSLNRKKNQVVLGPRGNINAALEAQQSWSEILQLDLMHVKKIFGFTKRFKR